MPDCRSPACNQTQVAYNSAVTVIARSVRRSPTADSSPWTSAASPSTVMWCADDHHRDPGARTTDPCASTTTRCCMTVSANHNPNRVLYRYQSVPIRAPFVPCHRNVHFCARCRQKISPAWPATDHLSDGFARTTGLIATSCQRATIETPIALRIISTMVKHPAVSSLEASPTPAL